MTQSEARVELARVVQTQVNTILEACLPLDWLNAEPITWCEQGNIVMVCDHRMLKASFAVIDNTGLPKPIAGYCAGCGKNFTLEELAAATEAYLRERGWLGMK